MKLSIKICLLAACAVTLQAEFLIIEKKNDRWAPLNAQDKVNKDILVNKWGMLSFLDERNTNASLQVLKDAIAQVMLKYQWPMVVRSDLTQAEQDELFNDTKPYAEERFIAKKLKQINPNYDVVFIPTSIYELFTINYILEQRSNSTFFKDNQNINIATILNQAQQPLPGQEKQTQQKLLQEFYNQYDTVNNSYYPDLFFEINNACMQFMVKEQPILTHMSNGLAISQEIQSQVGEIAASLIGQLDQIIKSMPRQTSMSFKLELENKISKELAPDSHDTSTIRYDGILSPVINLEYQARQANKAFLLRGTRLQSFPENDTDTIIASTPVDPYNPDKIDTPYSMSFGNSLFAGIINDPGACAYQYISRIYSRNLPHSGFAVMIDKKDCYHNPKDSLFFIPPLGTLSGLVASGEWFHARLKAADPSQQSLYDRRRKTPGIAGAAIKDPLGIFYTDMDPVEYAKKYSLYVADNLQMLPIEKPTEQQPQDAESSASRYGFIHPSQVHSGKVAQVATEIATKPIADNQIKFAGALDTIYARHQSEKPKPVINALPSSFNVSDHIAKQNSADVTPDTSLPVSDQTSLSTDEKSYVPDGIDITTMPKSQAQNTVLSDATAGNSRSSSSWFTIPTSNKYTSQQSADNKKFQIFIPEQAPFIVPQSTPGSLPHLPVSSQTARQAIKAGQKMLQYA